MEPEQLYAAVKKHKDQILADELAGHSDAKAIVSTYNMLVRFPEPVALAILEQSFENWLKRNRLIEDATE